MGSSGLLLGIWWPAGELHTTGLARNAAPQLDLIKLARPCWVKQRRLKLCMLMEATASTRWSTEQMSNPGRSAIAYLLGRGVPLWLLLPFCCGEMTCSSRVMVQDGCNNSSHLDACSLNVCLALSCDWHLVALSLESCLISFLLLICGAAEHFAAVEAAVRNWQMRNRSHFGPDVPILKPCGGPLPSPLKHPRGSWMLLGLQPGKRCRKDGNKSRSGM